MLLLLNNALNQIYYSITDNNNQQKLYFIEHKDILKTITILIYSIDLHLNQIT